MVELVVTEMVTNLADSHAGPYRRKSDPGTSNEGPLYVILEILNSVSARTAPMNKTFSLCCGLWCLVVSEFRQLQQIGSLKRRDYRTAVEQCVSWLVNEVEALLCTYLGVFFFPRDTPVRIYRCLTVLLFI